MNIITWHLATLLFRLFSDHDKFIKIQKVMNKEGKDG